jgi:nucleoid-associated protein EbfC
LALMEMYVERVSTRKVKDMTEELRGTSFYKSLVSSLAGQLDSELGAWRSRPQEGEDYPYLFVDARYEKARTNGRVVSQSILIVCAVREDGMREILAVEVADTESEATYHELFRSLKRRGLKGVQLVVSDDHEGLKGAVSRHFQQSWQVGTSASRPSCETRNCSSSPTQHALQSRWTASDPRSVERYTLCSDFVWTHCQIRALESRARSERRIWVGNRRNVNKMMQQVQQMQQQMQQAQEELANETVTASAGGGAVKATMTGSMELVSIEIDPDVVDPEDVEMLQDMVLAAVNEAMTSSQELANKKLGGITGGLGDLGLNLPGL